MDCRLWTARYKKNKQMKKYDIVVAGAGLGGLITAAILAREGYSVCVLEKSTQLGGAIQSFTRKNVIFDAGAHYIGGVEKGQNLDQILRFLNVREKLKLKKLDNDAYDKISFLNQGEEYNHSQGFEGFRETLLEKLPSEKKAVDGYINTITGVVNDFPLFMLRKSKYSMFNSKLQNVSIGKFFDTLTTNEDLKNVLAGNNLLYAGQKYSTPLTVHGLIHYSYLESAYRFLGGTSQLANLLADEVKANGGLIKINTEVKQFEIKNGNVENVIINNGEKIFGKHFISNMHPSSTFELIDENEVRKSYYKRIVKLENTISVFSLYGVFKKGMFPFHNSNHYIFRENEVWGIDNYDKIPWPGMCMFLTQPVNNEDNYARGFTTFAYMKFEEVEKWENTTVDKRGNDYLQFKKEKAEKVLDLVEQKFPHIRKCIQDIYTSSPLTYRDYTGTVDGSLYGVVRDANHPMTNTVLPNTKIPNLMLAGQNITMHGVMGVAMSALLVCSRFIGMDNLVDKIHRA